MDHGTLEQGARSSTEQATSRILDSSALRSSSCGSWNRTNITTFRASHPTVRRSRKSCFSSGGRNRTYELVAQRQAITTNSDDPGIFICTWRVPCGSRTHLASLEGWHLCRSAKGTCSGRSESRTHKAHRSTVFETAAIANWLVLPKLRWQESNLRRALNRRLPVPTQAPPQCESAQLDLNQRSPVPETGGIARLSHTPNAKAPSGSRTRTSAMARQRLPLHHGRLLQIRFSCQRPNLSEHRAGLEPGLPHYGCGVLAAGRPVRVGSRKVLVVSRK